jgi:hypothetical protein
LVLVDDQVPERGLHHTRHRRFVELCHGPGDQLSVGEQPELLKQPVELLGHAAQRFVQLGERDELVLDNFQVGQEGADGREQLAGETLQAERGFFPAQERGQPPVVEHVECLIPGHVLLEQAEAVRVDGSHERRAEPVKRLET